MGGAMGYQKFCYWVDSEDLKRVRGRIEQTEERLQEEPRIPCRVLRSSRNIGYIDPGAWTGFCKRRTSWYQRSNKTGKFLVASNKPLEGLDIGEPIIIKTSHFKPDHLPSYGENHQLIKSEKYQSAKPDTWEKVDPLDINFYHRWFARYRPNDPFDFEKLFAYHSANHANFIDPRFLITTDGIKAPYSIADSIHVCSSCVEFFNILGEQWPLKYVVPCIGAVQFAHLPMDQYLEVRFQKKVKR